MARHATQSRALPWLARMIAQQCKVQVRFDPKASTAYTTAQREIVLPAVPANDPKATALTLGLLVHEAAHARFTDFEVGKGALPAQEALHQVIEDLRIERAIQIVMPGAAGYLAEAWEMVYQEGKVQRPGDVPAASAFTDLASWLLAFCRWQALGLQAGAADMPKGRAHVVHHIGEELTRACEDVFDACTLCSCTMDTYDRAGDLLRLLGVFPKDDEGSEDQDSTVAEGNQGAGPCDGAQALAMGTAAAEPESGIALDPADLDCMDLSGSDQEDLQACLAKQAAEEFADPMGDVAKDLLRLVLAQAQRDANAKGASLRLQVGASIGERTRLSNPGDGAALFAKARAATTALRARMHHLLQTLTESKVEVGRRGRPLVTQLWRLRTGNPNVFEDEEDGIAVDTAVLLLLDVSGSMQGKNADKTGPIELAKLAAMAVVHALDGVQGVECAAYAFPGERGNSLCVSRVKGFQQRAQQASAAIAGLVADGGTPLAAAVYAVGPEIAASRRALKVLVVVSDGDPDDREAAKAAIQSAEAEGVEVMGLGIKQDLSHLIRNSERVDSAEQLAPALFKLLSQRQADFLLQAA